MIFKPTIPNLLTGLRVALIPIFVIVCYLPAMLPAGTIDPYWANFAAALIFAIASATDWLDGLIARRFQHTTELGAFLDPIADKLLVACALVLLVRWDRTYAFLAIIIISREICVTALRELMARKNHSPVMKVAAIGKWKTAAQMTALILLLLGEFPFTRWDLLAIGNIFLVIAAALTIISFIYYLRTIVKKLR